MGFGVFIHRADSIYNDSPASRYQFPRPYFERASTTVGDWIVYYEPRRPSGDLMKTGGTQAYLATGRISDII